MTTYLISNNCIRFITIYIVLISTLFVAALSADHGQQRANLRSNYEQTTASSGAVGLSSNDLTEHKCADCKLTSLSVEDLIGQPRQMDAYGQMADRIDLDKIKKAVCKNISHDKSRERCKDFFLTQLDTIRKWKQSNARTSFFDFVCIKELKFCCPRNSHGPKCSKCMDCGPNEHCHGEGTRSGNGTCVCKEGHTGLSCTNCLPGYYLDNSKPLSSSNDLKLDNSSSIVSRKFLCKPCHRSCVYCRQEGPLGCDVCREGFTWVSAYGCSDIDECIKDKKICGENTFCVNTEGSYFCYECDHACDGCHGDGPDMCLRCAKGYKLDNENCVALKKTILPPEANYYSFSRCWCRNVYRSFRVCNEHPCAGYKSNEIILKQSWYPLRITELP